MQKYKKKRARRLTVCLFPRRWLLRYKPFPVAPPETEFDVKSNQNQNQNQNQNHIKSKCAAL